MKRLIALFIVAISIFSILKLHYKCTDGFRADKVIYRRGFNDSLEQKNDIQSITSILDQEYDYLGKGRQVYVFESRDKAYVIKLVRYHKYQRPYWTYLFENIKSVKKTLIEQEIRYLRAMKSYLIAADELGNSTEVLYMHLNRSRSLNKKLIVKNKIGRKVLIDLDSCAFIIQKKANSYKKTLVENINNNQKENVEKMVSSFIDVTADRVYKGIYNRDPLNAVRNAGTVNNKYIDIDIGSYYKADNYKTTDHFEDELIGFTKDLRKFLEKYGEKYLSYFDNRLLDTIVLYNKDSLINEKN